jgi:hypothetical protein
MTLSLPTRDQRRAETVDRLLTALDALVRRHRGLALHGEYVELHAELIAAEVAHELSVARSALLRHPPLAAGRERLDSGAGSGEHRGG